MVRHAELLPLGQGSYVVRSVVLRRTGFAFDLWEQLRVPVPPGHPEFDSALYAARRQLHRMCRDPRFLEAVLLSSPAAHDRIHSFAFGCFPEHRTYETRRRERLIAAYLQRFCTKCETTSFFGPFGWSRLQETPQLTITGRRERRIVHPALWASAALARLDRRPPSFSQALEHLQGTPYPARVAAIQHVRRLFEAETGLPGSRGAGKIYADREVFVEECVDEGVPESLPAAPLLKALGTIDALASRCQWLVAASQADARALLSECLPAGTSLPLSALAAVRTAYLAKLKRHTPELRRRRDQRAQALFPELFRAVERGQRRTAMQLCESSRPASDGMWDIFSPDILIAAEDAAAVAAGHFEVVLGEIHSVAGVFGYYLDYHRQPASVLAAWEALWAQSTKPQPVALALTPRTRLDVLHYPPSMGFVSDEAGAAGVALHDLRVERRGGDLCLVAPGTDEACWLQPGRINEAAFFPLGLFARPTFRTDILEDALLRVRSHLPRVSCGETILCRETWRFSKHKLGDLASRDVTALLQHARQLRVETSMPRRVFIRGDASVKPVAVDFENPFALELFAREIRRAQSEVVVREMLPAPSQLWYRIDGKPYCCELRVTIFRGGEPR